MSQLVIEMTGHVAVLVAAVSVGIGAKALASVLRTWIVQAFLTRRVAKALEDAMPHQRPGILEACGHLEGRPVGEPSGNTADYVLPSRPDPRPRGSGSQNKRDRKRQKE
jgi:hypothetical protein